MAEFLCKLGAPGGEILQKVYVAETENALRAQMEEQGYYVFGIEKKFDIGSTVKALFSFSRKKVSDKQFMIFNQEMAALVHSGLPLLQCLELLVDRSDNPNFTSVLEDVYRQVKSGTALSDAFTSHPDIFPRVYTASILAGEKSGTLEQVIRRYLGYLKISLTIRKKVVSSLIYPALLLMLSCCVVGVLVGYVIPKFSEFYKGFAGQLPLLTVILVAIAKFVRANGVWLVPGLIATVLIGRFYIGNSESAAAAFDGWKLRMPFVGDLYSKFSISQLMRTLHTLLAGGIPLVNAIDVAASAVANHLISRELGTVSQSVKEGEPLWISLKKTGLMTKMAVEMVKVGEETGALEEMLRNISDFYDEEIDTNLTNILAVVEPVMLMVMGLVVAAILLAMYYPMFSAIGTIQ
jgi:type IV pilus assembly protein PilC